MLELLSCGRKNAEIGHVLILQSCRCGWIQSIKTSSDGNIGLVWVGFVSISKEWDEILVCDSVRTQKLLANLSNHNHIVGVRHSMNLIILSRPLKKKMCSLLVDIFHKRRNGLWQEAAEMSGHTQNKGQLFTFALTCDMVPVCSRLILY